MRLPLRDLVDRIRPPVWCVSIDEKTELPALCACCAAPVDEKIVLEPRGPAPSVPYCAACAPHASLPATRTLAVGVASSLIAVTLAACWPLARPFAGAVESAGVAVLGAMFPALTVLWQRAPAPPHRASGRAVRWLRSGSVACKNLEFAESLSGRAGTAVEPRRLVDLSDAKLLWVSILLAVVLAPVLHRLHHPRVRIVNLTDRRLLVAVDGQMLASVEPTGSESPAAGVEVRAPAGKRSIVARHSDGTVVDAREAAIRSGHRHVYAPGDHGHCFWLETTGYGRRATGEPDILPFSPARRFFTLETTVDSWFSPNPPASDDTWSSGGQLTALRQAACRDAPPAVRRQATGVGRAPSFATPAQ